MKEWPDPRFPENEGNGLVSKIVIYALLAVISIAVLGTMLGWILPIFD